MAALKSSKTLGKSAEEGDKKSAFWKQPKNIFIGIGILVFVGFIWLAIDYVNAKRELAQISGGQVVDIQKTIDAVSKLILLPEGESPQVATIKDADILKADQPFYEHAQNGHKLLLYTEKAIIYDEVKNIIINVGPVFRQNNQQAQQPPQQAQPQDVPPEEQGPLTIEIRNGSKTIGVAQDLSLQLDEEDYNVIAIDNAVNRDYQGNLIVNQRGRDVNALKDDIGANVTESLPEGEKESEADVVIILGTQSEE